MALPPLLSNPPARYTVFRIHWLMAALVLTKSISLLLHSVSALVGSRGGLASRGPLRRLCRPLSSLCRPWAWALRSANHLLGLLSGCDCLTGHPSNHDFPHCPHGCPFLRTPTSVLVITVSSINFPTTHATVTIHVLKLPHPSTPPSICLTIHPPVHLQINYNFNSQSHPSKASLSCTTLRAWECLSLPGRWRGGENWAPAFTTHVPHPQAEGRPPPPQHRLDRL